MSDENKSAVNEAFYDEHIAPALLDLAKKCRERGMAFLAAVEIDAPSGFIAATRSPQPKAATSSSMRLVEYAERAAGNIDSVCLAVSRDIAESGKPNPSVFLHRARGI